MRPLLVASIRLITFLFLITYDCATAQTSSPSKKPSKNPSKSPSSSPSTIPSSIPSSSIQPTTTPSSSPSKTPSLSPSTSSRPSSSIEPSTTPSSSPSYLPYCFDEQNFLFQGKPGQGCYWVGENPQRCSLRDTDSSWVHQKCRKTCDKCVCLDDPNWVGDKKWKTCEYVSKKAHRRCITVDGATDHCIKSCRSCCKNNKKYRYNNKRSCIWVARAKTEMRCQRRGIAFNCPIACGLCNYSDYRYKQNLDADMMDAMPKELTTSGGMKTNKSEKSAKEINIFLNSI